MLLPLHRAACKLTLPAAPARRAVACRSETERQLAALARDAKSAKPQEGPGKLAQLGHGVYMWLYEFWLLLYRCASRPAIASVTQRDSGVTLV